MVNKKKKEELKEFVYVDVLDVLELAKKIIMESHGGIYFSDVEYMGSPDDKLKFQIPVVDRKGRCQEICSPDEGEDSGCGETGGACICGKKEGHKGNCKCELCGEEW